MGTTVALVFFGMFSLSIIAMIVLALYAKGKIAKFGIDAVGRTFEQANKNILPLKMEKSEPTKNTGNSTDVNSVL